MLNVSRPSCVWSMLLCLLTGLAASTAKGQVSTLDRQLSRIDLAVSGVGEFSRNTSGTVVVNAKPTTLTLQPSTTLGALVTFRYTKSPYMGAEINYGYARYTQNFNTIGGVQQNASEYTLGYVAHTPKLFGISTFVAGGGGAMVFRPTSGGGQGLVSQARGAYYYAAGVEDTVISPHFGVRAQIRQIFYTAPDFYANYLATGQHTSTFEPGVGIYLKF